ncbi:MAG: hypothetical protein E6Q97_16475 [Desulfurellales bacterium]|nr:MAG: hypothetical protein E6Q97_16475 [Desulfurellales bacterium]
MTPEYLDKLADFVDPDHLWKLSGVEQMALPRHRREQLDAGIALRRHAAHVRELRAVLAARKSLLITPLSNNSSTRDVVDTPEKHAKLRKSR